MNDRLFDDLNIDDENIPTTQKKLDSFKQQRDSYNNTNDDYNIGIFDKSANINFVLDNPFQNSDLPFGGPMPTQQSQPSYSYENQNANQNYKELRNNIMNNQKILVRDLSKYSVEANLSKQTSNFPNVPMGKPINFETTQNNDSKKENDDR